MLHNDLFIMYCSYIKVSVYIFIIYYYILQYIYCIYYRIECLIIYLFVYLSSNNVIILLIKKLITV